MNNIDCLTNYSFNEILKGLQIKSSGTNIPAFFINIKTYSTEVTTAIMEANKSYEDYFRLCVVSGDNGTLKLNVCFLDIDNYEPFQSCNGIIDSIAPMFCVTNDGTIALKLGYVS